MQNVGMMARSVMASPIKMAAVGAGVGVALSQFHALTTPGESGMPTAGGAVGAIVKNTITSAIINAGIGALLSGGRPGGAIAGAKSGAIMGAVLGASLTGGQLAGGAIASTVGY
ncbi:MAG: hypothetical protein JWL76_2257 [Thermoleophilia bacterium]|nr:hypothetical protein [Thermoleophilia bacterium]